MGGSWKAVLLLGTLASVVRCQEQEDEPLDDEAEPVLPQEALLGENLEALHQKMDENGDGKVSVEEITKFSDRARKLIATKDIGRVLEEMDTDKDGKLSSAELDADMRRWSEGDEEAEYGSQERRALELAKFQAADANGNGMLEQEELASLFYPELHSGVLDLTVKASLEAKDKNRDGMLDLREWFGGEEDGEELAISDEEQADFVNLDQDKNGKVDLTELREWESGRFHIGEAIRKLFKMADSDRDGHITMEELSDANEHLAGTDAQYHLMEWAEHHSEL